MPRWESVNYVNRIARGSSAEMTGAGAFADCVEMTASAFRWDCAAHRNAWTSSAGMTGVVEVVGTAWIGRFARRDSASVPPAVSLLMIAVPKRPVPERWNHKAKR